MRRCRPTLSRCAVMAALLLTLGVTPAGADAGGRPASRLTQRYPLGTQTLCCRRGAGRPGSLPGSTGAQSPPSRTTTASAAPPTRGSTFATPPGRGNGRVLILLVVAIVGLVLVLVLAAFDSRAGLVPRRTRP